MCALRATRLLDPRQLSSAWSGCEGDEQRARRGLNGRPILADSEIPEQGWQLETDVGRIDLLLEGEPPLDFASVSASAIETSLDGVSVPVADLAHLVAFKRLAGRPQDRVDLDELTALNGGALPMLKLPGID